MHRAQCYYDLKDFKNAIEDLDKGLNVKDDDPQVHYRLGLAFYAAGNYKECTRSLK